MPFLQYGTIHALLVAGQNTGPSSSRAAYRLFLQQGRIRPFLQEVSIMPFLQQGTICTFLVAGQHTCPSCSRAAFRPTCSRAASKALSSCRAADAPLPFSRVLSGTLHTFPRPLPRTGRAAAGVLPMIIYFPCWDILGLRVWRQCSLVRRGVGGQGLGGVRTEGEGGCALGRCTHAWAAGRIGPWCMGLHTGGRAGGYFTMYRIETYCP